MTERQVRYATKDVYAEVEEEGGKINRLVAKAGQVVPVAYEDYVDDADTTTDASEANAIVRSTSARRARIGEEREERSHEEFREIAQSAGIPESERVAESADDLPIEDYDELSVEEIVDALEALPPDQVARVQAYEAAHKDRKGVREFEPSAAE